jgi:hypothetical protein
MIKTNKVISSFLSNDGTTIQANKAVGVDSFDLFSIPSLIHNVEGFYLVSVGNVSPTSI